MLSTWRVPAVRSMLPATWSNLRHRDGPHHHCSARRILDAIRNSTINVAYPNATQGRKEDWVVRRTVVQLLGDIRRWTWQVVEIECLRGRRTARDTL